MIKKLTALSLALAMVMLSSVAVFAAGDITWTKDTTLTNFINRYNNATVKAGVTLTMKEFKPDPQGLEIVKSLTVEQGGKITGGGSIIFERGASCTGLDLYYRVAGKEKLLSISLSELIEKEPSKDYRPTFMYDSSTGHYVLMAQYDNDPFETPQPADGGNGGSGATGNTSRELAIANQLKELGLMQGAGTNPDGTVDFALDRAPTRVEAMVLLLRLLGKGDEASAYDASKCPFSDAPVWAREELAYAYDNGLTNGIGGGKFGTDTATVQQFLTFVLRAMGYSDANGEDFSWSAPESLAMKTGILGGEGDLKNFTRGTCVRIMEAALRNSLKTGGRLWEKLAADGVFTEEQYKSVMGVQ